MTTELDHGIRCAEHAGEVFPPRCRECDAETADHFRDLPKMVPTDKHGHCLAHPEYASCERWPCARCLRDGAGAAG